MVNIIRLQRIARMRNHATYTIAVMDSKKKRDTGAFVERIGWYHPIDKQTPFQIKRQEREGQKEVMIDFERAKYWISKGAQVSHAVHRIFSFAGILPPTPSVIPKGWDSTKFDESYMEANRYFKQKFKIENATDF
jgi:small subunit ribosomal protein S16